jgi:hypothetical protein
MRILAVERLAVRFPGTPLHTLDTPAHDSMPRVGRSSRPRIMDQTARRHTAAP